MTKSLESALGRKLTRAEARHHDRILGCLFGLAVGDALGAPVEFLSRDEILAAHGPTGVQGLLPWGGFAAGSYTDDTQMSLATAQALVDMLAGVRANAVPYPAACAHERYLAWYATQAERFHRRAPGNTCLAALASGKLGTLEAPINDSKGCGGAMRTAPVGLWVDSPDAFELGAEFAAVTHGHPSGYLPAGVVAELVAHLRGGKALPAALAAAKRKLKKYPGHDETLAKLTQAQALARATGAGKLAPPEAIAQIGEGWVGDEAVGIAVYCALTFPANYAKAVLAAVNITGDSDSTGSITGALVGTALGYKKLPAAWVAGVEGAEGLRRAGDDLFTAGVRMLETTSVWRRDA